MNIHFEEVSPEAIQESYPAYFQERTRYFEAVKDGKTLCSYGVISRTDTIGEAFLMMKTFQGKVLSKGFFLSLFEHAFSLGYREIYTWTSWDRLIRLFRHFEKLGIEPTGCPPWDKETILTSNLTKTSRVDPRSKVAPTKTWFTKKIP